MTPRKPLRAILYARVSTDRGEQDPESQLVAERSWAAGRDLVVIAEFADRITSDPKRRRRDPPGLTQAIHLIEDGKADVLVIFAADRLVADPLRLLQLVTRVQDAGGTITSVQDEEIIRRGSHQRAWLTCSGFNGSSLAFYRWCGYQETQRTRETHGCGVEVEEVRMERLLLDGRREI